MEDDDFECINKGFVVREWGIGLAEAGTVIEHSEGQLGG